MILTLTVEDYEPDNPQALPFKVSTRVSNHADYFEFERELNLLTESVAIAYLNLEKPQ